ncbi:hypothetical protein ACFQZ4_03455 [Catellatospora coxensis]
MTDRQPATIHTQRRHDSVHGLLITRDHHRGRTVHRRDTGPARERLHQPVQRSRDLFPRSTHRDHRPTGRQRLHQPAPRSHQRRRIRQ